MSVEEEIGRASQEANRIVEDEKSIISILSGIAGSELYKNAADRDSFIYSVIQRKFPNIIDRELMAAVIDKKYLSKDSNMRGRIDEIYRVHSAAIEQGHPSPEYRKLIETVDGYYNLRTFLTIMNDTAIEDLRKEWDKEATEAVIKNREEEDKKKTIEIFENYKILVPSEKSREGNVEMTLSDYLDGIATKAARGEMSDKEFKTRVAHLKANFTFIVEIFQRKYILDKYIDERKRAREEWLKWQEENNLFEATEKSQKELNKSAYNLRKATIKLAIAEKLTK